MSGVSQKIRVVGPASRAAIVGAYLAARCAGPRCEVEIAFEEGAENQSSIVTRPDIYRIHDEMGLPLQKITEGAILRPVFATEIRTTSGAIALPHSPFGETKGGIDFVHYWTRANTLASQPELTDFSPAIVLARNDPALSLQQFAQLPFDHGIVFDRSRYTAALLDHARTCGGLVEQASAASPMHNMLVIDLTSDGEFSRAVGLEKSGWQGNVIRIDARSEIPGIEWQTLVNAARRIVALSAHHPSSLPEQSEYTRLAEEEAKRITSMRSLLFDNEPIESGPPELVRKIDVFASAGRIPMEDYEVFSPSEWLSALFGRGFRPASYNRLADAMPEQELLAWLASLSGQLKVNLQRMTVA